MMTKTLQKALSLVMVFVLCIGMMSTGVVALESDNQNQLEQQPEQSQQQQQQPQQPEQPEQQPEQPEQQPEQPEQQPEQPAKCDQTADCQATTHDTGCASQAVACDKTADCKATTHDTGCASQAGGNEDPVVNCDQTADCKATTHDTGCASQAGGNEGPVVNCDQTADCKATTHDAGCASQAGGNEGPVVACDQTAKCQATTHAQGCIANGEYLVKVKVEYYAPTRFDSGGSHYDKTKAPVKTVTEEILCKLDAPKTIDLVELGLDADAYIIDTMSLSGGKLVQDMQGGVTFTFDKVQAKDYLSVKAGLNWTARTHIYNYVLKNGSYSSQFTLSSTSASPVSAATALLPKDGLVEDASIASDVRDAAYTNFVPTISQDGEYAGYGFAGKYTVYYVKGATVNTVADSATGVDKLADYGMQIDPATGAITSLDGQTSPVLSGNEYFLVYYYFAKTGEAEQGNVWLYELVENPAGTHEYKGKKYEQVNVIKETGNINGAKEFQASAMENHVFADAALFQYTTSGWVSVGNQFGFKVDTAAGSASVTVQPGFLAINRYYDSAATVTVNKVYHSSTSATPVFTGTPDFNDTTSVKVAANTAYTASSNGTHDGYTLVKDNTTVSQETFEVAEDGSVVLKAPAGGETATITYYYYRQNTNTGGGGNPDPDPETPTTPGATNYSITVNYVDQNNNSLRAPYSTSMASGSAYDVSAQTELEFEGYTLDRVEGDTSGTLNGSVEITVYYVADGDITITDPDTPLGNLPDGMGDNGTNPGTGEDGGDEVVIVDPETPLGNLPNTGANGTVGLPLGIVLALLALGTVGAAVLIPQSRRQ